MHSATRSTTTDTPSIDGSSISPLFAGHRYRFTGHELVYHDVRAADALEEALSRFGYRRVFVVSSRTLNTQTDVVRRLTDRLGSRVVGSTDAVGEHAPLSNVLRAAMAARNADADVILSVGGGSVMDMCKVMQLCISEEVYTREQLLGLQFVVSEDGSEMLGTSTRAPRIRQIAIPTTLATAEWTPASTPIDDQTRLKARFVVPEGGPRAIIYDPDALAHTPARLLLSTGIRGLDHAINTACSSTPHPFASLLAEKAIRPCQGAGNALERTAVQEGGSQHGVDAARTRPSVDVRTPPGRS